jgi:ATP-dependent DNA helicase RecG
MPKTTDINLNTPVAELPLVGSALTKAFAIVGVSTVADLLYYFPTRYMDYRKTVGIGQAVEGDIVTLIGQVKTVRANFGFRGRMSYAEVVIEDGTGKIRAVWFNQTYIAKQLKVGDDLILSGKVGRYKNLQLTNPAYEIMDPEVAKGNYNSKNNLHTGRIVPIYKRGDLIPLRTMRRLITACLPVAEQLEDPIPKERKFMPIRDAIQLLHFPDTEEQVSEGRFRIAVGDVLPQQIAVQMRKAAEAKQKGFVVQTDIEKVKLFLATLPFELTPSQKRAAWDIFKDLEAGKPMNRLLQGDVGSGKTIVSILAALQTAGSGFQTALLAPTEILAKQHYDTFRNISDTDDGIALFTRSFTVVGGKEITKAELEKKIASGEIKICIGTHALLQGKSNFKNLALLIIDEQHRFGVAQRSFLLKEKQKTPPHLLSMSATPIPRTLAMSLYADLAVSTLSHVPSGRKPVHTAVVPEAGRDAAYEHIRREAGAGHQAFIVTPRVEDTEASDVRSVKKEFARLQKDVFPELRLGLLYGKMKGAEKDAVMAVFAAGEIDILVATSVIEIGIDIPNATSMIIEGSERFGLAQLHQLRGRIGRNNLENYCFLFTTEDNQQDTKRLNTLSKTTDGFALAALDLEERGFGDLFGKQQSGFMFRFPQFISVKALAATRDIAAELFNSDPKLKKFEKLRTQAEQYLTDIHAE